MLTASSGPSKAVAATTQAPSISIPRLPARPAICSMLLVSSRFIPRSPRFAMEQITVVLAGISRFVWYVSLTLKKASKYKSNCIG